MDVSNETITVTVNGDDREIPGGLTVRGLLAHLGLQEGLVVVEWNREIVRRGSYDDVVVSDGDVVELVHFVGGG